MNYFKELFSREEVNTGRQEEFDYLKGFFMIMIFMIHSFQATLSKESPLEKGIYIVGTMVGITLFMFVMGFGTAYSKKAEASDLAKGGLRLIIYQYLSNLLYVICLALPYLFVKDSLSPESNETYNTLIWVYLQFINVFFVSGIIYLIMAVLKKMKCKPLIYVVLAVIMALAAPLVYGVEVDIPVLGYIVKLLVGEDLFVPLPPVFFISYALLGVAAGQMYRHIKDKAVFYKRITPISSAVVVAWWISVPIRYGTDFEEIYDKISTGYTEPDLWRVVASIAHIALLAALVYFLRHGKKDNPLSTQLLFYNKHISKYYALHISVYFVALGFHKYQGFEPWQCWLLMILCMIVTEIMVRTVVFIGSKKKA